MYFLNPLKYALDAVHLVVNGKSDLNSKGVHPFADLSKCDKIEYFPAVQTAIIFNDNKVIDLVEIKSLRAEYSVPDEIEEEESQASSSSSSTSFSFSDNGWDDESTSDSLDIWEQIALETLPATKFPRSSYRRLSSRKTSLSSATTTATGPSQSSPVVMASSPINRDNPSHSHSPTWAEEEPFFDAPEVQPVCEETVNMNLVFEQLEEMKKLLDEIMEEREREKEEMEKKMKSEWGWGTGVKALLHWLSQLVKEEETEQEQQEDEEEWAEWVPGIFW